MIPTWLPHRLHRRAIILRLILALAFITLTGVIGMAASVIIVEKVRGSASAINVSGSLRMQSHRMGNLVLAGMLEHKADRLGLALAINRFEASLTHDALRNTLERAPSSPNSRLYMKVKKDWVQDLKPLLLAYTSPMALAAVDTHQALLGQIDAFVADIDLLVAGLERDTEAKISLLRTLLGIALGLTLIVVLGVLYTVRKRVLLPLTELVFAANSIAKGDFQARAEHVGRDELGQVGQAFNLMADELSRLYQDLEQRVNEKTEQLTRSNRSLELLYHSIARLNNTPVAPEAYRAMLEELEQVLGLRHSMVCLQPEQNNSPRILATTLPSSPGKGLCANVICADCVGHTTAWSHRLNDATWVQNIPLRDADRQYGVLQIAVPVERRLEPWEYQLIEALSRHIGIAIGIAQQTERDRRIALMDERSVIARELHDSIAQALSYMKIQASLLQQTLDERQVGANAILKDLREGINAAYKQLRELLATFRLRMEGDFLAMLQQTTQDYAQRSGLRINLDAQFGENRLSPNQEIHVLQIVREALNNVLHHAEADNAWVALAADANQTVTLTIEDDGRGIATPLSGSDHYGLSIMRERAQSLHGEIDISPRAERGTRVRLRFNARRENATAQFEKASP